MLWSKQISGVKVYQADKTPEEVIMECDFMWAGQQVHMPALSQLPSLSDCVSSNPRCVKLTHSTVIGPDMNLRQDDENGRNESIAALYKHAGFLSGTWQ